MKSTLTSTSQTHVKKTSKSVRTKTDETKGLRDLFVSQLKEIYGAEKTLANTLPKFIKNASNTELEEAFTGHLEATLSHSLRLERIFAEIGKRVDLKKCDTMESLLKDADKIIEGTEKGPVRDSGMILISQKIEHFEIASYASLAGFAYTLGEYEAAALLDKTLNEEREADDSFSQIAQTINIEAFDEVDED